MLLSQNNNISFRGHGAQPLEYLVMRNSTEAFTMAMAKELQKIGRKTGFKVAWEGQKVFDRIPEDINGSKTYPAPLDFWLQDKVHFMKNKLLSADSYYNQTDLHDYFGLKLEKIEEDDFVKGGNMFFVRHKGANQIIVGADEDPEKVKKLFKIENIIRIPQADYHLDLFIKPLKDDFVLVADDDMTIQIMEKASKKLKALIERGKLDSSYEYTSKELEKTLKKMQTARKSSKYADTNEVIKSLKDNGFKPVRVPGRIYYAGETENFLGIFDDTPNILNYLNSIVHQKEDGELVLITNKSNLYGKLKIPRHIADKIGLDFERKFKHAIKNHVSPRDIYFITGDNSFLGNLPFLLEKKGGGIHCLCAEVPKGIRNPDKAQPFDEFVRHKHPPKKKKRLVDNLFGEAWQKLINRLRPR